MKLCSLNARGLGEKRKRKSTFTFFRNCNADLILVQETHLTQETVNEWRLEWGGEIMFSNGTSNSRGVVILLHPRSQCKVLEAKHDNHGRCVSVMVEMNQKKFVICNVYGPNTDSPTFFKEMIRIIDSYQEYDGIVIGGDFNLVINPEIDRNGSSANHTKVVKVLKLYMECSGLVDVWRDRNTDSRRYTWHRWNQGSCSVEDCEIKLGHLSDHSMIEMSINIDCYQRGPGVWKFNNLHLRKDEYCDHAKEVILQTAEISSALNPNDRWEVIKMELGRFSKEYAKQEARHGRIKDKELMDRKSELLKNYPTLCEEQVRELEEVDNALAQRAMFQAEGSIFRSKCKYVRDGEKCREKYESGNER